MIDQDVHIDPYIRPMLNCIWQLEQGTGRTKRSNGGTVQEKIKCEKLKSCVKTLKNMHFEVRLSIYTMLKYRQNIFRDCAQIGRDIFSCLES